MEVVPIPQLRDNYAYLVIDPKTKKAAVVDCAEALPVQREIERRGVELVALLPTHHHYDHVGGHDQLLRAYPVEVLAYAGQRDRIPGCTREVREGDKIHIGELTAEVIFIPAHTTGHVAYYFPEERVVFTGDTLFVAGCGRLFEGDAAMMMASLAKLASLPDDTRVYCGHEYTLKNLEFALELEPNNAALRAKYERVRALRQRGVPTVPSTIGEEKATNPFLRWNSSELQGSVRRIDPRVPPDPVAIFAKVRELKDAY
ncbi:MAG: hydroxyacylglutathione hydrolase [Candidatus Binatia bacterium]|nr:MAG: hydroxyacylglutathione hydrolase [Candidatus Binatia bacterium]